MPAIRRQVYVISDLHLGGAYAEGGSDRGFRICTRAPEVARFVRALAERPAADPAVELVINGDLVDFLAERHEGGRPWRPFNADPAVATRLLRQVVERDREVFDALAAFLAAGHRLVLLLGNHDVELALPQVRAELERMLGARGRDFTFLHDGEAYVVGDALIEHGNEYDLWNRVNQAQLRRLRADLSRNRMDDLDFFEPPAGSRMVAEVINPIKESYRFVDLLKPESGAAVPLLLALEPGYRSLLAQFAANRARAADVDARRTAVRALGADIGAVGGGRDALGVGDPLGGAGATTGASPDPLHQELRSVLGDDGSAFLKEVDDAARTDALGGDISAGSSMRSAVGSLRLLLGRGDSEAALARRLPLLRQALAAVQDDVSFDRTRESKAEYWDAAVKLARGPIKHVVFGHTHLPKRVPLPSGGFYLNTGTWADVLRFPAEMLAGDTAEAETRLAPFVQAMRSNDFSAFSVFHPTYVRLDLGDDGAVARAELCDQPV